jgi:hypothetical protein
MPVKMGMWTSCSRTQIRSVAQPMVGSQAEVYARGTQSGGSSCTWQRSPDRCVGSCLAAR